MEKLIQKENFKMDVKSNLHMKYKKDLGNATNKEIYYAVCMAVKKDIVDAWMETDKNYDFLQMKKTYYLSAEFLPGRFYSNNLMNLGSYEVIKEALEELKIDINEIENQERDPALGNGGLGRLGSCFLESSASLGYPVYGCGIKYKYGLFKQDIKDGGQRELADDWGSEDYPWEIRRDDHVQYVKFGGNVREILDPMTGKFLCIHENYDLVKAIPYDIPIVGARNGIVNTLRLWDAKSGEPFSVNQFNQFEHKYDAVEDITKILYPNDQKPEGKKLRLRQQYFFVSASLQQIVAEFKKKYKNWTDFPDKVCLHLNDTHPTLAVPELMRILMDEHGLSWEEAWIITTKTCAFTNHTIMAEAMEKWPVDLFEEMLPRIYKIVQEIDRRFLEKIDDDKKKTVAIIEEGQIRMANMAIIASFSVNGVAKLHTEILKSRELKAFYELMPEKFNNKTNGISHRRFLYHANPELARMLRFAEPEKFKRFEAYADDEVAQLKFMKIKRENKVRLAEYIEEKTKIKVNPDSIFDVQIKRFHEYKRQLLNIMRIMHLYNELKNDPEMDFEPMTFIFAGKAAASYHKAKLIMKLIHSVADTINNDTSINDKIKVVFLKDYNVTMAELIIPGSDVSEQISTASKEASGTGNMKFMMNGAVTIGTLDGANVEIRDAVGEENMFLFGMTAKEVMEHEKKRDYMPCHIYLMDPRVKGVMDQLVDGTYTMKNVPEGQPSTFIELWDDLIYWRGREADTFFVLKDFDSYMKATLELNKAYQDKAKWAKMAMLNTANSGIFSSDRTIKEYAKEIWKLQSYFEVD